jgi:hypothetical protein
MIARKAVRSLLLALVLTCGAGLPARAGSHGRPPHWQAGGALLFGDGLGDFGRAAGEGFGLSGHFVAAPGSGPLGLRVQLAGLGYGSETVPAGSFPGTSRVHLEVETDNWYFNLVAGPQLMKRSGPVRPYVNVLGGFSYFSTISGIRGDHDALPFAQTTNFDDVTLAWSAGGGLIVPLGRSVGLDLGARYLGNSTVDYLAEGDLFEDEDGTLVIAPRRSRANVLELTLGVSVAW